MDAPKWLNTKLPIFLLLAPYKVLKYDINATNVFLDFDGYIIWELGGYRIDHLQLSYRNIH